MAVKARWKVATTTIGKMRRTRAMGLIAARRKMTKKCMKFAKMEILLYMPQSLATIVAHLEQSHF
jgi:hypothetical protein